MQPEGGRAAMSASNQEAEGHINLLCEQEMYLYWVRHIIMDGAFSRTTARNAR
jgi:hypothetical protein